MLSAVVEMDQTKEPCGCQSLLFMCNLAVDSSNSLTIHVGIFSKLSLALLVVGGNALAHIYGGGYT